MKPYTVFWLCFTAVFGLHAAVGLMQEGGWLYALPLLIQSICFIYWYRQGIQETRHHQEMQQLINDMAQELRSGNLTMYRNNRRL